MTILQLKYVVVVSTSTSMRAAAGKLYVSQPALSAAIKELEEEIGIKIFERTNRGISLTEEGLEFVSFAKQAVSQYEVVEMKYIHQDVDKDFHSISIQHFVFAVHAFAYGKKEKDAVIILNFVLSCSCCSECDVLPICIAFRRMDNRYIIKG